MRFTLAIAVCAGLALSGCATSTAGRSTGPSLERALAGQSQVQGARLDALVAEADQHPLGSDENPVRAAMPVGQRAYLARLRCGDGSAPDYRRVGNFGIGVFGNIVDGYAVTCSGEEAKMVVMDMYHPGHVEDRPVPGFTIVKR